MYLSTEVRFSMCSFSLSDSLLKLHGRTMGRRQQPLTNFQHMFIISQKNVAKITVEITSGPADSCPYEIHRNVFIEEHVKYITYINF